ncbi:MAG: NADH-quinone oxidoreductase subunit J [Chloroflexi bacterium HGW-Chloroflexi-1]|nr:MAG: NADH-quinone oxidoreductase subunit J [Chloroflexi bacterium HGW-Chloroflexi-1]
MQPVIFALLALITLGAAIMVVTTRNLLRAALWLILAFFGIAGIFILLNAEFLAVAQILIYVGAIATLIIFAIMLTHNVMDPTQPRFDEQWGVVGGFAALLFVALAAIVTRVAWPVAAGEVPADAIQRLGAHAPRTPEHKEWFH